MNEQRKRLIVVLGMHRSGTSAITRGLMTLGVALGDKLLPPVQNDNAKGYFEDVDLNALNIEIMQELGNDWHRLAPIEDDAIERLRQRAYFLRAIELLRKKTTNHTIFGFKDPRIAKLLPFWHQVFAHCGFDINYVLSIRNPLSVAQSLAKRAGFTHEKSHLLWLEHALTSLRLTQGRQRVLVDYDHLLQAPQRAMELMAHRLALQLDPQALHKYQTEFLDQNLRHTQYATEDLMLDHACPPLVQEMYAELVTVSHDNDTLDLPAFHTRTALWSEEFKRFKSNLPWIDRLTEQVSHLSLSINTQNSAINQLIGAATAQDPDVFQNVFNAEWYTTHYPDVKAAGIDPYLHYIQYGRQEGRLPSTDPTAFVSHGLLKRQMELSNQIRHERSQSESRQLEFTEREKAFSRQVQELQQAHKTQKLEQNSQHAEREQALHAQLDHTQQQIQTLLHERAEREKTFAEKLQTIQQEHARQTDEQRHEQAERERILTEQLTETRHQLEIQMRELIVREKTFAEKLQTIQQEHARQTDEQHHEQAERERILNTQLINKQEELFQLTRDWLHAEQVQTKTLNQLREQLNAMRNTFSWRLTAPLRNLARLFSNIGANLVEDKNGIISPSLLVLQSSKDEPFTNKAASQSETQNKSNNTSKVSNYLLTESNTAETTGISNMSQNQSNSNIAASTLDELLSYHDEQFIRCAYLTLLGRTPDADGMAFYLKKIRAGVSKTQIIYQMKSGKEGKSYHVNLTGLNKLILIRRWISLPLLHTFVFKCLDGGYTGKKLRILENHLYQLDEKNKNYHVKIDTAISNLRKLIIQQVQSVIATHNDPQQPKAETLSIGEKNFDAEWYLQRHADVAQSGITPYEHYKKYGRYENRSARYFDSLWYSHKYPDISKCGLDPYDHYINYGKAEGREMRYFNPQNQLYFNGDASESSCDPYEYYVNLGLDEGRKTEKFAPIKVDYLDVEATNYYGYIRAVSGLGNANRGYIHALQHSGINVSSLNLPCGLEELDFPVEAMPNESAMFNMVHMNADSIQYFFSKMGKNCLDGRYNIGLWVWELAAFRPDWYDSFEPFHEIWVPSEFCKQSISAISPVPVYVIPHIVEEQIITAFNKRSYFDLPEEVFIFGYMFDCSSSIARKNPFSLIEAFQRAFGKNENVILLLKFSHGNSDPELYQTIRETIDGHHNIKTIEYSLNEMDVRRFFEVIDCYASSHRSEGFGLTIAEAMLAGKPVIATDYGGSTDFVNSEHAYPVRYSLVPIDKQHGPYLPGYIWAEPDIDHLVERLKEVYEHQEIAFSRGQAACRFIKERYSVDRIADIMKNRLKMILQKNTRMFYE